MYRFRVSDEHFDARYLEKYLLSHSAQSAIDAMKTGGNDSGLNTTYDHFKPLPVADELRAVFDRIAGAEIVVREFHAGDVQAAAASARHC